MVPIEDTTTVIAAGADFNLDVSVGDSGFQWGRLQIMGPGTIGPAAWREAASVHFTRDTAEAIGHSIRASGLIYKTYLATYSKQNGDAALTFKIFDSSTPVGNRYIALKDAVLTGSNLRLTFHNYHTSSQTLWVKGQAQVF